MAPTRLLLTVLALATSVAIVTSQSALYSTLTSQPWNLFTDWFNLAFVAPPFLVLALIPARRLAPWLVALALTLLLWGAWLYLTVDYFWHPDGSGANIGMGLLLVASPIVISSIAAAVHFALADAAAQR